MGVEGLHHYVLWHRKCCLQDTQLHDCRVLIDGSNLAYLLYNRAPGILPAYGGDYAKYAAYVAFFFSRLRLCNIYAVVVMDGGQPRHNIKLQTCTTRLQTTLDTCLDSAPLPPHSRVFPLHARSVFTHVLRRVGVPVLQSDAEADRDLAFLAPRCRASVLSNDSDFFLYGARFIPLDFLRFTALKETVAEDGSRKYKMPCKVFLHHKFLQLSSLQPRHLGLLGALSGNDCVPASLLARFHKRLVDSASARRDGHTRRQQIIRHVLIFLKEHRTVETAAIVRKACDMAGGDAKLQELLLLVADSYRPRSSPLTYWFLRLYPPTTLQVGSNGCSDPGADAQVQGDASSYAAGGEPEPSASSSGAGGEPKLEASALSSGAEGPLQQCPCEVPWAHLCGGFPFGGGGSCGRQDVGALCDEGEATGALLHAGDDTDDPPLAEANGDVDSGPDDSGELEDDDGFPNDNNQVSDDEAPAGNGIGDNDHDDGTPEGAVIGPESSLSLTADNCDVSGNSVNVEQAACETRQILSKKTRKNELQDLKLLRKMQKKMSKKKEPPVRGAAKSPKENSFDHTGMNAEEILRELERTGKNHKARDNKTSGHSEFDLLSSEMSSECENDLLWRDSGSLLQLNDCGHAATSLVTDSGFRLPGWLVYGYRHAFITREISDVVTNAFCISQPQVESVQLPSSYKCVEALWKMIVAMVRGGGHDNPSVCCNGRALSSGLTMPAGDGTVVSTALGDAEVAASAPSNTKANKKKSRKDPNIIRWFIRKKKNLYIENVALDLLLRDLSQSVPSLRSIELMSLEERKRRFLHLTVGALPEDFLGLPDEVGLVLSFICYWYKNSLSSVTENHLLSVVFTFFVFYFVYGNAKRVSLKGPKVFCLHCCLASYCTSLDNEKLRFIVDNLECLTSDFNWGCESDAASSDSPPAHATALTAAEKKSCEGLSVSDLLPLIPAVHWSAVSRAVCSLHSSPSMTLKTYYRHFVHSMSEFQACAHYLSILNGLFIAPFKPVSIDHFWSGTFCYGVYSNLCHLGDGGVNLIALLLGQNSPSMRLFIALYEAVLKILRLEFSVPNIDASPETAAEQALKAMFRKVAVGEADSKKRPATRRGKRERCGTAGGV